MAESVEFLKSKIIHDIPIQIMYEICGEREPKELSFFQHIVKRLTGNPFILSAFSDKFNSFFEQENEEDKKEIKSLENFVLTFDLRYYFNLKDSKQIKLNGIKESLLKTSIVFDNNFQEMTNFYVSFELFNIPKKKTQEENVKTYYYSI